MLISARNSPPLPPLFVDQMAALLGREAGELLAALHARRTRALRLNPAKTDAAGLAYALDTPPPGTAGSALTPVPWCPTGYAVDAATGGGHTAHLAGLYYLQEPSAMLPAEVLAPEPGWRVADLAAAPGGKTTHLSALVGPSGLVLANEVAPARRRVLHESLDLWGGAGLVTSGLALGVLAQQAATFDGVLLDAPCSGEALFRRRPAAIRDWSPAAVTGAARRQARLLADAARLVRPDGVLVYSTCTFNREENEDRVVAFLTEHPGWQLEPAPVMATPGVSPALSPTASPARGTAGMARLWPHRAPGEGQFVARLRAPAQSPPARANRTPRRPRPREAGDPIAAWTAFHERYLPALALPGGDLAVRGDTVYLAPANPALAFELLARPGLPLGRARPGRFEPAHSLATAIPATAAAMAVHWDTGDEALRAYLSGEVIDDPGPDGWVLVCWRRWPIGWARRRGGALKNMLPDHVRRLATPPAGTGLNAR